MLSCCIIIFFPFTFCSCWRTSGHAYPTGDVRKESNLVCWQTLQRQHQSRWNVFRRWLVEHIPDLIDLFAHDTRIWITADSLPLCFVCFDLKRKMCSFHVPRKKIIEMFYLSGHPNSFDCVLIISMFLTLPPFPWISWKESQSSCWKKKRIKWKIWLCVRVWICFVVCLVLLV